MAYVDIANGLRVTSSVAVDSRFVATTLDQVYQIRTGYRYKGLRVFVINENQEYWFRDGVDDTQLIPYAPVKNLVETTKGVYSVNEVKEAIPSLYSVAGATIRIVPTAFAPTDAQTKKTVVRDWSYNGSRWVQSGSDVDVTLLPVKAESLVIVNDLPTATSASFIPNTVPTNRGVVVIACYPWNSLKVFYTYNYDNGWVLDEDLFYWTYASKPSLDYTLTADDIESGQKARTVSLVEIPSGDVKEYRCTLSGWIAVESSGVQIVDVPDGSSAGDIVTILNQTISNPQDGYEANVVVQSSPKKISKYVYLNGKWEIMSGTQEIAFQIPASGTDGGNGTTVTDNNGASTTVTIPHNFSTQYVDVTIYDDSDDIPTRGPKVYVATECVSGANGNAVEVNFEQAQADLAGQKFIAVLQK